MTRQDPMLTVAPDAAEMEQRPLFARAASDPDRPSNQTEQAVAIWLCVIVLIALGARLLLVLLGPAMDIDLAVNAAQPALEGSTGHEGPLMPMLISAVEAGNLPRHVLILTQCLLGSLCVVLTWAMGWQLLRQVEAPLLAAIVVAVHPGLVIHAVALGPGTWALCAILAATTLVLRSGRVGSCAVAGLLLAAGALLLPALTLLALPLACVVVLRQPRLRSGFAACVLVAAAAAPHVGVLLTGQDQHLRTPAVAAVHRLTTGTEAAALSNGSAADAWRQVQSLAAANPQDALTLVAEQARLLIVESQSVPTFYRLLDLTWEPVEPSLALDRGDWKMAGEADPAGAWLVLGSRAVDASLLLAAAAGAAMLVWRGRAVAAIAIALLLAYILAAAAFTAWPDTLRLLLPPLLGLLACAPLAPPLARREPRPKKARKPRTPRKARIARSFDRVEDEPLVAEPAPRMTGRPI